MVVIQFGVVLLQLLTLINAWPDVQTIPVDMCDLKETEGMYHPGWMFRTIAPDEAGREGIHLANNGRMVKYIDVTDINDPLGYGDNSSFSFKFYMKLGPRPAKTKTVLSFGSILNLLHTPNDRILATYMVIDKEFRETLESTHLEIPDPLALPEIPETDDSTSDENPDENETDAEWVQLTGIKVKNSRRRKRSTTLQDKGWILFGIDFFNQRTDAVLRFYANKKLIKTLNFTDQDPKVLQIMTDGLYDDLRLYGADFSCAQLIPQHMSASYYADVNLHECRKKYQNQPEEKYTDCEQYLRTI